MFLCRLQFEYTQGGQNVRIVRIVRIDFFLTLKLYGLYGFVFKLYGLYGFLSWKINRFFLNFHSFQQIFHENKKNSRQNEVSLTYFLHSK